jgi:hypothetical protein
MWIKVLPEQEELSGKNIVKGETEIHNPECYPLLLDLTGNIIGVLKGND